MTTEEQDALVGRVLRESRAAEDELNKLLVRAEHISTDLWQLSADIKARVRRAKNAGRVKELPGGREVADPNAPDARFNIGHLSQYAKAVDLEALDALDREITGCRKGAFPPDAARATRRVRGYAAAACHPFRGSSSPM